MNRIEIVKILLSTYKIDINMLNIFINFICLMELNDFFYFYLTPLQIAVRENNFEMTKILLQEPNINVNIQSINKILFFFFEFNFKSNYFIILFQIKYLNEVLYLILWN